MSLLTPFRGTFVYAPLYAKCLEHLQANEHLKNTKTSQNNAGMAAGCARCVFVQ